ncbi:MAG: hypothetical protein EU536_04325 [Promethearchaeota archaeon]|nr:MAG: hypothetical protein EU536_04325 [Candidatus Lokiarchaeota archaeon]
MPKAKQPIGKKIEVEYEVTKYAIGLFSRPHSRDPHDIAIISLWEEDSIRGYLNFFPNTVDLPNPSYNEKDKVVQLYFHVEHFDVICDLLRNEKPIFINYQSPPPFATLRTGKEPIGEEETLFYPRE